MTLISFKTSSDRFLASTPKDFAQDSMKCRAKTGISSARSRNAGMRRRMTFKRCNKSSRKAPAATRASKFWWVDAMMRTFALIGS